MLLKHQEPGCFSLRGELTLETAAELLSTLRDTLAEGPVDELDLSEVDALDVAGLQVLWSVAAASGASFTNPSVAVVDLCALTGVTLPSPPRPEA